MRKNLIEVRLLVKEKDAKQIMKMLRDKGLKIYDAPRIIYIFEKTGMVRTK